MVKDDSHKRISRGNKMEQNYNSLNIVRSQIGYLGSSSVNLKNTQFHCDGELCRVSTSRRTTLRKTCRHTSYAIKVYQHNAISMH